MRLSLAAAIGVSCLVALVLLVLSAVVVVRRENRQREEAARRNRRIVQWSHRTTVIEFPRRGQ